MKKINNTMLISILVILTYVMSACSGVAVGQSTNDQQSSGQAQDVVFTGTVDSMGGGQWTISGQAVAVDGSTSVDANIAVGDNVKVEARVGSDGSVTATSIETSSADDSNANSNDTNQNDNNNNANDDNSNLNDNQNDNSASSNDNGNGNSNDNSNPADDQEVSGVVEAITTDSITIGGVVYQIADFTEFKELITLGDNVKLHVIINADGTFTIREIEKSVGIGLDNSNSNSNGSDDNSNVNSNSNGDDHGGNGNDDNSNDDGNGNSNDDTGNDNSNSNGNG